jgi:predicted Zn-dependent protease
VEFGLEANGADAGESFAALVMDGGDLPDADVLAALGTGVYVSNLWYLNHSDRNAARFTGMTRFATFWVEDGEIVAPLAVMRFDDSVYDLLGPRLERVGARVAMLPSMNTYGGRSTSSQRVPGVLLNGLSFTL